MRPRSSIRSLLIVITLVGVVLYLLFVRPTLVAQRFVQNPNAQELEHIGSTIADMLHGSDVSEPETGSERSEQIIQLPAALPRIHFSWMTAHEAKKMAECYLKRQPGAASSNFLRPLTTDQAPSADGAQPRLKTTPDFSRQISEKCLANRRCSI